MTPSTTLLRFNGVLPRDPAIDTFFNAHPGPLSGLARSWFERMRHCGDEVRELFHDSLATACFGDVPFAYVGIFRRHVTLGFFRGSSLPDPHRLLLGEGQRMRHVKLVPGATPDPQHLEALIAAAYDDIRRCVEHG